MLDMAVKRSALDQVYRIHQRFMEGRLTACVKGCDHCCTRNVTLTTLEAHTILSELKAAETGLLLDRLRTASDGRRFRPEVTLNHMARLAAEGREVPDEHVDPSWGQCPLLDRGVCPIYRWRPFSCRSMVSSRPCASCGSAVMDPWILTVNAVFQQVIEHLDAMGCTGNLTDILLCLENRDHRERYTAGRLFCREAGLLPNRPLKVLMVPPEHRKRIQPILAELYAVRAASGRDANPGCL